MIQKIAVIGAGTMGHSIAENFAMHGYDVKLYDLDENRIASVMDEMKEDLCFLAEEKLIDSSTVVKALQNIRTTTDLAAAVSDRDYLIEAAPENLALKQNLFRQLDELCPDHAIFASNTSSLSLEDMMKDVTEKRRQRMMVNHWYNPAHIMPLVELSFFGNMPESIFTEVEALYKSIGKQTVKVLKDVPGLVANRIQQGVAREVFSIMEQEIASPEDVEKALMFGPAFRYATTGQLEIADMGGLDIWCTVGDNLLKVMDNRQSANPLLREKVESGKLGMKTGEGFFKYNPAKVPEIKKQFARKLVHQLKASAFYKEKDKSHVK
ncbi:UNVERIFIED_ORG: 3-hydroxybutyryl-CoA dehydrogenase [Heyndrickxia coagulans]